MTAVAVAAPQGRAAAGLVAVVARLALGRFCAGAHTTSLEADVDSAAEVLAEGSVAEARAASAQPREARPTVRRKQRLLVRRVPERRQALLTA
jgi:hypothetical protein